MRPLGFVGPTFPPEVNERLQYEVLLPFMLHIIYDAFGRGALIDGDIFKVRNLWRCCRSFW